jgi:hypothetical protein
MSDIRRMHRAAKAHKRRGWLDERSAGCRLQGRWIRSLRRRRLRGWRSIVLPRSF